jgi:hypothetical protein
MRATGELERSIDLVPRDGNKLIVPGILDSKICKSVPAATSTSPASGGSLRPETELGTTCT